MFRVDFPGQFKSSYPTPALVDAATKSYAVSLAGFTKSQVLKGMEKAKKRVYMPNPAEFAECCKPTFEDFGFPSPAVALQKLRHWRAKKGFGAKVEAELEQVIYTAYMSMDVYLWVRMPGKQSREHFEQHYLAVIDGFAKGQPLKEPQKAIAAESVVKQEFKPGEVDDIRKNLRATMGVK